MSEQVPPFPGLPSTIGGRSLAWASRNLESDQCVACGQTQAVESGTQAILCGRCALVLADAAKPQVIRLTPEEQYALNRRKHREEVRDRRGRPKRRR